MEILIHFGFPKTGSSTLQFGLLEPMNKLNLLNLKTWRMSDPNEHLDRRPSSTLFNGLPILDDFLEYSVDKINVLSDESFTAPTRLRRQNYGSSIEDPLTFPEKIKSQIEEKYGATLTFVPFIVIRNHADLLYSQYVEEFNLKKFKGVDLLFNE